MYTWRGTKKDTPLNIVRVSRKGDTHGWVVASRVVRCANFIICRIAPGDGALGDGVPGDGAPGDGSRTSEDAVVVTRQLNPRTHVHYTTRTYGLTTPTNSVRLG